MAEAAARDAVWLDVLPSMKGFGPALAKGAGAEADKQGKGIGKKFGVALLAGTAAVAGGAALAAKALYGIGETFDEVSDTIRVGTGATGDALAALEESAKRIGTKVPAEFEAIGTMVADVNTRLGLTGPTLEKFASQALEAGRIMGEEIDINAVSAAFNAFQVQGEDTTAAMDHLYRVSQATGVGMNELATNAATSAPALQALGFTFEETTALVGNLDKAGMNSSKMMAGMSRALVELAKDGEEPQEAFKRVTGEIQGFLDEGNKAAAVDLASQLFGTRNASQFIGALESGALAMDDLGSVAGMTEDTILGAGKETMDFAEQWQIFKNQVLVALEPIASRVFNTLGKGMEWLNTTGIPYVKSLWESFKSGEGSMAGVRDVADQVWAVFKDVGDYITTTLVPAVQDFVAEFRDGEGTGGRVRDVFDRVWTVFKGVGQWMVDNKSVVATFVGVLAGLLIINKVVTAVKALNLVLRANPIGIVITLIAALVAALVWLYNNNETARRIMDTAWAAIKKAIKGVVNWFKDTAWPWMRDTFNRLRDKMHDTRDKITGAWEAIRSGISTGWDKIKSIFDRFKEGLSALRDRFRSIRDGIRDVWRGLTNVIARPINAVIGKINTFLSNLKAALNKIPGVNLTGSWSIRKIILDTASGVIGGGSRQMLASGGRVRGSSPHDRADNIPAMLTAGEYVLPVRATRSLASRFGPGFLEALRRGLPGFASGGPVGGFLPSGLEWVADLLKDAGGWVKRKFEDLLSGIGDSWPAVAARGAALSGVSGLAQWIKDNIFGGGGSVVGGQRVNYGGRLGWAPQGLPWQAIWALIKMAAPEARMTSNYRPGAITASGVPSLHGQGRAVDIVSSNMRATFLKLLPLLRWSQLYYTPMGGLQIGYRDSIVARTHWDHIHAALADGGLVRPLVADSGAMLRPGLNLLDNRTGGPEPLIRADHPITLDEDSARFLAALIVAGQRDAALEAARRQRQYARAGGDRL